MTDPLLRTWNFMITLSKSPEDVAGQSRTGEDAEASTSVRLGDGGFQECSGLEVEMDVQELLEGGRNDGVIRRVGRAKFGNIVLKRGMFYAEGQQVNRDLWEWIQGIFSGARPVRRYHGRVEVRSVGQEVAAVWEFERGLPAKVKGPQLDAQTGEVAIEELHIAHEGLRLVEA